MWPTEPKELPTPSPCPKSLLIKSLYLDLFSQVIFDSGSRGYWLNELFLLLNSDVDTCLRLQCADTLFTALDNCRDIVQVSHFAPAFGCQISYNKFDFELNHHRHI
jgi:hypothetical protein